MCFLTAAMLGTAATATSAAVPATAAMTMAANMGLAMSAISTGTAMYGQHQQGKQAKRVGEINQQQANIESHMQKEAGLNQAQKIREQTRQTIARQSAESAAGGGDTTQGSSLDILKDTARIGAMDEANTITNTERKSLSSLNEGRQAYAQGKFGKYSSRLNMTGSALSGAGQVADKWYRYTNA